MKPMTEYRKLATGEVETPVVEMRRASALNVRTDNDTVTVEGYATVYDEPYDVGGLFTETIARGAAAKSANEADVRFLVNHGGIPLARTKSGTMTLTSDDVGLKVRAELSAESTTAADVLDAMTRGDLDEMSFAFQVLQQSWNDDWSVRSIREVKLVDVSAVTYPANPATHVQIAEPDPSPRSAMSLRMARSLLDTIPHGR